MYIYPSVIFSSKDSWKTFFLPVVQGFDRLVPGLSPRLDVQSEAQEEPLQMHKHHFVEWVSLSVVEADISMLRVHLLNPPELEKKRKEGKRREENKFY